MLCIINTILTFNYDRINVSGKIFVNKKSVSKECDICRCWYFLNKSLNYVCNRYHNLLMMSMNLSDIAILNIKGSSHRCIISRISKNETINIMENTNFTEKKT